MKSESPRSEAKETAVLQGLQIDFFLIVKIIWRLECGAVRGDFHSGPVAEASHS